MATAKRILVLYYSLTGQMDRVLDAVLPRLEEEGHQVEKRRIEPVTEWELPFDPVRFYLDWAKTWAGRTLTQPLRPLDLSGTDPDCILLGFQPWYLAPSIPVNSFLHSDAASVFRGRPVVALVTCRNRWERALKIARDRIHASGGRLIDSLIVQDQVSEPANMATTYYRLMEDRAPPPGHWMARFPPFGIGDEAVEVVRDWGRDLALRLSEDRLTDRRGWRVVNGRLKLV